MISIIAAVAENGVIGADGAMPWCIAEDLRRFRELTWGHPVVMGRRTFESIGRPLEGRNNLILSRQSDYAPEGTTVVRSLEEALAMFGPGEEIFVAGGGEVYRAAMPLADRIYLTRVGGKWEGNVTFPTLDPAEWCLIHSELHRHGEHFPHSFEFMDYERV